MLIGLGPSTDRENRMAIKFSHTENFRITNLHQNVVGDYFQFGLLLSRMDKMTARGPRKIPWPPLVERSTNTMDHDGHEVFFVVFIVVQVSLCSLLKREEEHKKNKACCDSR
jgi:hypothetical protein